MIALQLITVKRRLPYTATVVLEKSKALGWGINEGQLEEFLGSRLTCSEDRTRLPLVFDRSSGSELSYFLRPIVWALSPSRRDESGHRLSRRVLIHSQPLPKPFSLQNAGEIIS